jgi:3-phenylpropionate/trans-cinnamate dioxygenase ferredoxin reductase subunit
MILRLFGPCGVVNRLDRPRVAWVIVPHSTAADRERVVVAGAGLAGLRTAEELRARGYQGQITLVGAETRPPYDRPPLSKKVLTEPGLDPSLRADFGALGVDFRPGEEATGLADDALTTTRGTYPFDHLVLATGALPVTLPGDGKQRFLRTYDDALALRDLLRPGLRLAIVGAGWIGAELATAATTHGSQVTVVEAGPAPLAAAIGAPLGAQTARWYQDAGVTLKTGVTVESVQPGGLALAGGEWIAADEIVTAVGVRPATGWLAGAGITLENGVAVDPGLRTSRPGVYAVGDCAAFESMRFGRRLRFEHWDVALHAPEVVAANVLGGDAVYDPVPYFWSEQFGRMVQYTGYHGDAERLLWRGDPAEPTWAACWLTAGRLVAILTVNRPRDLQQARRLIASATPVDPALLTDPAVPVRQAASNEDTAR